MFGISSSFGRGEAADQSRVGKRLIDRRAANQRSGVGAACLDGMKTSLGQKTKSTNVQICNNSFVQQSCVFVACVEISKGILVGLKHVRNNVNSDENVARVACLC